MKSFFPRSKFFTLAVIVLFSLSCQNAKQSLIIKDNYNVDTKSTAITIQDLSVTLLSFSTGSINYLNNSIHQSKNISNAYSKESYIKIIYAVEIPDDVLIDTISIKDSEISANSSDDNIVEFTIGGFYTDTSNFQFNHYNWSEVRPPIFKNLKNSLVIEEKIHNIGLAKGTYNIVIKFGINGKIYDYLFEGIRI